MTEPKHFDDKLPDVISNMETDIREVKRWADVLIVMSGSCHCAQPDTLSVLGNALRDIGLALEDQFDRAFDLSHPKD